MRSDHVERAFEILRKEGPVGLLKRGGRTVLNRVTLSKSSRVYLNSYKNKAINGRVYENPADPFATIYIEPAVIDHVIRSVDVKEGLGQIRGGEWDRQRENFKGIQESPQVIGFEQRFQDGLEWKDTEYYDSLSGKYEEEYISRRLEKYEEMFCDIKNNGYKEGHAGHMPANLARDESLRDEKVRFYDRLEVLVVIDRNGEISLKSGRHRFSIARVLGQEIPVQVVRRHKQWQAVRDDIYYNGISERHDEGLRHHPDLQDVLD